MSRSPYRQCSARTVSAASWTAMFRMGRFSLHRVLSLHGGMAPCRSGSTIRVTFAPRSPLVDRRVSHGPFRSAFSHIVGRRCLTSPIARVAISACSPHEVSGAVSRKHNRTGSVCFAPAPLIVRGRVAPWA